MTDTMTPNENFKALLNGSGHKWIPFTLDVGAIPGFTKPILERFKKETGAEDPAEYFDYDFRTFSLTSRYGGNLTELQERTNKPDITFDEWGIGHWAGGMEGTYEQIIPPLANAEKVSDIEALPFPIIDSSPALSPIQDYHKRGYTVFGYAGSVYEWSWFLRGMDTFMMDLLIMPDIAEAILDKIAQHTTRLALASAGAGIDVLCFYDDAGMQTGMQISPELWRKFIKPRWTGILSAVRSKFPDAKFFLHSCGKINAIIPDMIDVGFHILHPLQPECMDFDCIQREFGKDVVLCASMSVQNILPFGTRDDVRKEVRRLKASCNGIKRGIICPSNIIQPETPWENIVAFVQEGKDNQ